MQGWDPSYGTSGAGEDQRDTRGSAQVVLDVERPAAEWGPLRPAGAAAAVVLVVDGVRRIDARLDLVGDEFAVHEGLCVSYAAGVVRCELGGGGAAVRDAVVRRALVTTAAAAPAVAAGASVVYQPHHARGDLVVAVQRLMGELEVVVARTAFAADAGNLDRALTLVDGPLRGQPAVASLLGLVKTHPTAYLPAPQRMVLSRLAPGERTPLFGVGSSWRRYACYLRLPAPAAGPAAGLVRVECSAELPTATAIALVDRAAATLPQLASSPVKDPRAPQNLTPVGGLERRLRSMLGDARLLRRHLRRELLTADAM
jgi:hypothetical protein